MVSLDGRSEAVLINKTATSHMGLFRFKLIKIR